MTWIVKSIDSAGLTIGSSIIPEKPDSNGE